MKTTFLLWTIAAVGLLSSTCLTASLPARDSTCNDEKSFRVLISEKTSAGQTISAEPGFAVEVTKSHLKFQTAECKPFKVQLVGRESEGIQRLSMAFVKLLDSSKMSTQGDAEVVNWQEISPRFVLTRSGITIGFIKGTSLDSSQSGDDLSAYWNFLSGFTENVFRVKLKELNVTDVDDRDKLHLENEFLSGDLEPSFQNFLKTMWKIMKVSINYAEDYFNGWTTTETDVTLSGSGTNAESSNPTEGPTTTSDVHLTKSSDK